jgi:RNA polymerase sigma factor (sigma-70 family)
MNEQEEQGGQGGHGKEGEWIAGQFEQNRNHLRGVAYRMLGSLSEADDAVQEAWLRLSRAGGENVENLGGWLTTVVARICLDMLRSRNARREESLDAPEPSGAASAEPAATGRHRSDPEREALLADSVGLALLVVLDKLAPAERLAFVLHDMFDLNFEEIGAIVGRSSAAARQLASRARRRVRGPLEGPPAHLAEQRRVVDAFIAAVRAGDFNALVSLLDPELEVHADLTALPASVPAETRGAEGWARQIMATARGAKLARIALINGAVGAIVAPHGRLFRAIRFVIAEGKIKRIDVVGDRESLSALDLAVLDEPHGTGS